MYLKRQYQHGSNGPQLAAIKVLYAGARQRFSVRVLAKGIEDGWMTIQNGVVHLATDPPLDYRIMRVPGVYCCHCGAQMASTDEAGAHVGQHAGPSPDRENPAGYTQIHYYDCTRIDQGG